MTKLKTTVTYKNVGPNSTMMSVRMGKSPARAGERGTELRSCNGDICEGRGDAEEGPVSVR